jgi:hypothetical protein
MGSMNSACILGDFKIEFHAFHRVAASTRSEPLGVERQRAAEALGSYSRA